MHNRLALVVVLLAGCPGLIDAGGSAGPDPDGSAAGGGGAPPGGDGGGPPPATDGVWPNDQSRANSDPWLAQHHAEIRLLKPRVLLLNFVNAKTNAQMMADIDVLVNGFREGSRYHAYSNPAAAPMLEYQIAYAIDLRDATVPSGYPYRNSSRYPRENPVDGTWGLDYEQFWSPAFAGHYGIQDPSDGHDLDLCELIDTGLVHEVWIYGDADVPDVSAAEILELKPRYDAAGNRMPGPMACAGNGCFDAEDLESLPARCTRTIRIGWVNNTRGPGCYMESWGHGLESMGNQNLIPTFTPVWKEFGDFNLNTRFGLAFESWYACSTATCLSYDLERLTYDTGSASGTLSNYVGACGNAHFAPNSRGHYDDQSPYVSMSTCEHFRLRDGAGGADRAEPFMTSKFRPYDSIATDCAGAWKVYWMQSMPGYKSGARADDGSELLSFLPFIFY